MLSGFIGMLMLARLRTFCFGSEHADNCNTSDYHRHFYFCFIFYERCRVSQAAAGEKQYTEAGTIFSRVVYFTLLLSISLIIFIFIGIIFMH